jgi:hypothetical protein
MGSPPSCTARNWNDREHQCRQQRTRAFSPLPRKSGAILALEGVSRRDFSMKVKEKMLLAGFVLLMLMVTVIYNDLMRIQWIEKLVPWR